MARVTCKDEGHVGESYWVDREDAFIVPRFGGGAYNRAGRMYPTAICVACTSRYYAEIQNGEHKGALKVNRWSKSGLTYQYEQFRRRQGLEPIPKAGAHEVKPNWVVHEDGSVEDVVPPMEVATPFSDMVARWMVNGIPLETRVLTETEQKALVDEYFEAFPGLRDWAQKELGIRMTDEQGALSLEAVVVTPNPVAAPFGTVRVVKPEVTRAALAEERRALQEATWDEAKAALVWEIESPVGTQTGLIRPVAENPYRKDA